MNQAVLESCSCSALRQAARHVTRFYDDALAPVNLSLNQYAILAKLNREGRSSLQALADLLVMDRSTLGHLLKALERRHLVTIDVAQDDRRQRIIAMSAIGRRLYDEAKPLWARAERHFETIFGAAESLGLRNLLKQIATLRFAQTSHDPITTKDAS